MLGGGGVCECSYYPKNVKLGRSVCGRVVCKALLKFAVVEVEWWAVELLEKLKLGPGGGGLPRFRRVTLRQLDAATTVERLVKRNRRFCSLSCNVDQQGHPTCHAS
jgi:hypothetical protein